MVLAAGALAGCADAIVGAECAEGYVLGDGRCVPAFADAAFDGAVLDGDLPDGGHLDGDLPDGGHLDGDLPDGAIRDGAPRDSMVDPNDLDGAVPDGSVGDGSIDGSMGDGSVDMDGSMGDGSVPTCDIGELLCGVECVRPESDPDHCGGCGMACGGTDVCVGGMCMPFCPAGLLMCGPLCIDPLGNDPDNCGACGRRCATGICIAGMCALGTPGHVVVVGHDYRVTRAGMNTVAGNAVFQAPGAPVEVLVYEGTARTASVNGVDRAINQVATSSGRSWNRRPVTASEVLVELGTADVLVILPQAGSTDVALATLGTEWSVGLTSFLRRGGVIVLFETTTITNGGTYQVLQAAGLFTATGITDVSGDTVSLVSPSDAVASGVPIMYRGETTTVWFATTESEVVIAHPDGPVVIHRVFVP
jgi:hypothetical protein